MPRVTRRHLTVETLPVISGQPQAANVVAGQPVTFSVTANSSVDVNYQWFKGNDGDCWECGFEQLHD